jgi:hypothetical protein
MKTIIYTKLKIIPVIFFLFLFLNSCGIYKYSDARKNPTNANERIKKNMEEGKGFRLGQIGKKSGDFNFATSNPLWRASLDILDFAPLNNVDYAGGIIVTDWFVQKNSTDQVKITVKFLSNEIRADGIEIIIHKKKCVDINNCSVGKIKSDLNNQIKLAILKKATLLQSKDNKKRSEEIGPVRLPGKKMKVQ